ncbi:MAG: hypothetical protein HRF47_17645 [Chloroflexota bacterium]|jgi:hypothetical protein
MVASKQKLPLLERECGIGYAKSRCARLSRPSSGGNLNMTMVQTAGKHVGGILWGMEKAVKGALKISHGWSKGGERRRRTVMAGINIELQGL